LILETRYSWSAETSRKGSREHRVGRFEETWGRAATLRNLIQ